MKVHNKYIKVLLILLLIYWYKPCEYFILLLTYSKYRDLMIASIGQYV